MTRLAAGIVIAIASILIAIGALAFASPEVVTDRPCIALDLTLYTYDGPLVIDGACVDFISSIQSPPVLHVVAHDPGDGIYRNGFEGAP